MLIWEIRNIKTSELTSSWDCPGNAAEELLILDEMHPGVFEVFEIAIPRKGRMMLRRLHEVEGA